MLTLDTEIININRVGQTMAKRLKLLGAATARDLLFYFPFRYDDFSQTVKFKDLRPGMNANVVGAIELIQNKRSPRKRMNITEALISDGEETIKVIWFNQPFIARNLKVGDKVSLAGKTEDDYGGIAMVSPAYEKIVNGASVHTQGFVPNYHLTANITQKQLRFLIKSIIHLSTQVPDFLPAEIKKNLSLPDISLAITKIHFPQNQADIDAACKRLAFDELFILQLQAQLIKQELKAGQARPLPFKEVEIKKFVDSLPFKLTDGQRKAAWEILQDLAKDKPMSRLLEGDVGSGKTVVAVMALLNAALNGAQSALMVPTEILARQHYDAVCKLLADFNLVIGLMTGSERKITETADSRRQIADGNKQTAVSSKQITGKANNIKKLIIDMIGNGEADIIIGTHALIQENIEFKNLGLAIIDEQHRFGVEQRKALIEKAQTEESRQKPPQGRSQTGDSAATQAIAKSAESSSERFCRNENKISLIPHLLSMTATPIPRSLALAIYGDLDISIINELPQGRKKIQTFVVPEEKRAGAYKFIREQIKQGRQVFVICPLIDISDKLGVKSVKEEFEKLDKNIFPDLLIGCLHGKMKAKEKEEIMKEFLENKIKILVSTSVVEVGVDVPNAAIMMIEGADRFGLAQLHQFRGRVGRGEYQSYCFLFSESQAEKTIKRLQALVNCHNGFELAKIDLKFRGPGEVYGTAQKGFPELKIASLFDYQLMKQARDEAVKLIAQDSALNNWPELRKKIEEVGKDAHLE